MINYNRLGYEIKTGFSKFLRKNFKWRDRFKFCVNSKKQV